MGREINLPGSLRMRPLNLDEFYAVASVPPDWLVDDMLIDGGLSVMVAKPKVGKTSLALFLVVCVANGLPFLDRDVGQGPVLLLSFEENAGKLAERLKALGATAEMPIYVYCGAAPKTAVAELKKLIAVLKPRLVVVDTLFRLTKSKDGNDYALMTEAMEPLLNLARESGSHILVVHHAVKGKRQGVESILGSTAIHGSVDTILIVDKKADGRYLSTEQRYGKDMESTRLGFDFDTGEFYIGSGENDATTSMRRAITSYLDKQTERVTRDAIKSAVKGKSEVFNQVFAIMVDDGTVLRNGEGKSGSPYLYELNRNPSAE
jgi:hypothetical protein